LKHASIEIWCVSDLLEHYPDEPRYQSSSQRKAEQLGKIFRGREPILVVAVGTTAFPSHQSQNGNVVIGTKVFMHNTHPNGENPDSSWDVGPFDTVVDSRLSRDAFDMIVADLTPGVESHFLSPPLNPAPKKALLVSYDYASLGTLNVTRSDEYERVDALTLAAYTVANETESAKSVETTFGLIRVQIDAPFLFVGGVVNRLGHFGEEVRPRKYAQNMVGGHNVGVALAWMLRSIDCAAGRQLTVQAS